MYEMCFEILSEYRISSYSFLGNYSFLNLEIQRSQYIRPNKVTVHKCAETIQGRKLYEEIRYLLYASCDFMPQSVFITKQITYSLWTVNDVQGKDPLIGKTPAFVGESNMERTLYVNLNATLKRYAELQVQFDKVTK